MRLFFILGVFLSLTSCQDNPKETESQETASSIVEKAIAFSGTQKIAVSQVEFDFRNLHYRSEATCAGLKLSRQKKDTLDVFYRGKFKRFIDSMPVKVNDSIAQLITESINSVHYFVQLPFRLKDEAVQLKKLESQVFNGKTYRLLEVNFKQENGGTDFDDTYVYWFDEKDYSLEFLAYQFHVNGGGYRFRVAKNRRFVKGMQFQDYDNYQPKSSSKVQLSELLQLFLKDELELVSEIITQNPDVISSELEC